MVYPKSRMEIPSMVFSFLCFSVGYIDAFSIYHQSGIHSLPFVTNSPLSLQSSQSQSQSSSCLYSSSPTDLVDMGKKLTDAMQETDLFKDIKVEVAPSSSDNRLGLFATQDIKADQVALSVPFDDLIILTAPSVAQKTILKDYLSKEYDGGWTGDVGMIAIGLLLELARSASSGDGNSLPVRKPAIQKFMTTWVQSLPSDPDHPVFSWEEDLQETLEFSSTKKIYRILDDIEEDAQWWEENIWGKNRNVFPETVSVGEGGIERDCFNLKGFQWAMSMVYSRSIFVDGLIRLVPIADYANHYDGYLSREEKKDIEAQEIQNGFFGTFGTSKGVQVKTPKSIKNNNKAGGVIKKGEEVFVSYGPKSPVDYLIEHGFIPQNMIKIASDPKYKKSSSNQKITQQRGLAEVAELTFSLKESADDDSEGEGEADRFYDDKLDILEFETPIGDNPSQSFDITSIDAIDPLMIQFLRLVNLGDMDAFLLESIFRKEVWDFMADPVSEKNEGKVLNQVMEACQKFLDEKDETSSEENDESLLLSVASSLDEEPKKISNEQACAVIRVLERRALTETILNMERESQALDLKEYYQERRLKSLGLDTEWSDDEANANPDVGWGQTRAPGSGDLDW